MKNLEIAAIFRRIAQILEIKGENVFRIRAYERAAQNLEGLSQDVEDLAKKDELQTIPGIGKDLAEKITTYISTGSVPFYDTLREEIPEGVLLLLDIPSIGPKTAKLLYDTLHIRNIEDLEQAIERGKLKGLPGIQDKTIDNMRKGIAIVRRGKERMTLAQATLVAEEFVGALRTLPAVRDISVAGSLRRQKETVRDIDILVTSAEPQKVMDAFVSHAAVKTIVAHGETKSSVLTRDDVQVDCRVVQEKELGAALLYFTGSKNFNIRLRTMAVRHRLKINEYGVFKGEKSVAGRTEKEIFKLFGMEYIEPELREDAGEIEAALGKKLPRLITVGDIRGDLHAHSTWSDGGNSIEEMAQAAKARGYEYIAITDHSQGLKIAGGLSLERVREKKKEIDSLNRRLRNIRILFGTEVDIKNDGSIDYPDRVLKDFDLVVAAVHAGFKQSREQLTKRLVSACRNKYVHIIAHPTGRLWGVREAYDIDFEEVLKAASETNTCLEINSFPNRLDLNGSHARLAKERGVRLAISTDSHETAQLEVIRYGVAVARRAWLEAGNVINTLPFEKLLKSLKK